MCDFSPHPNRQCLRKCGERMPCPHPELCPITLNKAQSEALKALDEWLVADVLAERNRG
jgi:hypothetical protein